LSSGNARQSAASSIQELDPMRPVIALSAGMLVIVAGQILQAMQSLASNDRPSTQRAIPAAT
jgi:hypothetical protein